MSGDLAARALEARFESIRRAELTRLHRKVASLSPEQLAEVDAITASVVHAIARGPASALGREAGPSLVQVVVELFRVAPVADGPPAAATAAADPQGAGPASR